MKANGICSQPMNQELPMNLPQDALAIHQVFKDSLAFLDGDDLPAAKHWAQSNHRENHLSGTVLFQWFNIWLMHINAAYHCLDCRQVRSEYPSTRQVLHGAAGPFQLSTLRAFGPCDHRPLHKHCRKIQSQWVLWPRCRNLPPDESFGIWLIWLNGSVGPLQPCHSPALYREGSCQLSPGCLRWFRHSCSFSLQHNDWTYIHNWNLKRSMPGKRGHHLALRHATKSHPIPSIHCLHVVCLR